MTKLNIGDTAYTFIGEKLCKIKITDFLDEIRVTAMNKDETYCVYKKYCYPSKEEAIVRMRMKLKNMQMIKHHLPKVEGVEILTVTYDSRGENGKRNRL